MLTVREAIELYSASYPRPQPVDEVIELVGLAEKRRARIEFGGYQKFKEECREALGIHFLANLL